MLRVLLALSFFIALWVALVLWSQENTLVLAAQGKISLNAAWGYRFRSAELLAAPGDFPLMLHAFKPFGARILCVLVILVHLPALFKTTPRALKIAAATAGVISLLLFFSFANPKLFIQRQRVMGGAALADGIGLGAKGEKIAITENCLAAVNPSDLRAISSLELIEQKSTERLSAIRLVDLKVVEENYRLLQLKDEKGAPLFSDAARAFAAAEVAYARQFLPELETAKTLCLIGNFDTLPQNESTPFSRARRLIEARKKANLDTKVIQLPAGFTRR